MRQYEFSKYDSVCSDQSKLWKHRSEHEEVKPFKYDECDKSFQSIMDLNMSFLDKSTKHPYKSVSFAAGSIEQMSLISRRAKKESIQLRSYLTYAITISAIQRKIKS